MDRRLEHESGEARAFYAGLAGPVRVGIEATGHTRWFERVLAELGHGKKTGDPTFPNVRDQPTHQLHIQIGTLPRGTMN
jgi:hypothetical protein